jgi:tetratricopeptide (TPR) repeat protein
MNATENGLHKLGEVESPEPVQSPKRGPDRSEIVSPWFLAILTLVAGPLATGPMIGRMLHHRLGYRALGWLAGAGLGIGGLGLDMAILLWRIEQYGTTLTLLLAHGICAAAIFWGLTRLFKQRLPAAGGVRCQRGTYRHILTGVAAGALLTALWGVGVASLYMLASDRLLSTLIPVAFDDGLTLFLIAMALVPFLTAGLIAGGLLGWLRPQAGPAQMMGYALALIWAQFTWLASLQITIAVPGFQAGAATDEGWQAILVPFTTGQLLLGTAWSIAMLLYMVQPNALKGKCRRAIWVPAINLCAAVALSLALGYAADFFLALGRHQERKAHISSALWCYQQGLTKAPDPEIASYLQYRAALIHHKLGHSDKARDGFRRVVTTYNQQPMLAQQADRFLDNLQQAQTADRRVVLPGVETQTQYTGAYCVPNSLALAMRYWGAKVDARSIGAKITGLGTGTYVVDQRWYAEQHDFRHDFLPMAGLADIKTCIDSGFPVLVYVPAHVFAIVGYDERLKTFVTYDVATQDLWTEYLQDDFIKAWKKQATTLVLAYPEAKAHLLPPAIRDRLTRASDNYLHFQLHYLDTLSDSPSISHLQRAAGENAAFFFPVTILYTEFPSLRPSLDARYDADQISDTIVSYFGNNFDEGTHLAGQRHDEGRADPDWALKSSVEYLIGQHRFEQIEQLLARVDTQGQLSGRMQYYNAMLALSQGRYETGLDRFNRASGDSKHFYAALASLQMENQPHALQGLVKALDGCT